MSLRILVTASMVLTLGSTGFAGVVTGRLMVGANPIAGANLDFRPMSGGGGVTESGDYTDAQGFFTATISPNNVYEMRIVPPAGSNTLVTTMNNVVIGATLNDLGTIQIPAGVMLSGRCVDSFGVGVGGINLDAVDANGVNLDLTGDSSDPLGFFSFAVPPGALEVRFDTTPVIGGLLAPRTMNVTLAGNQTLGNVAFEPGFMLTAITRRQSNNLAVGNVDVDVVDVTTGQQLYTPGDDSDVTGWVDVVVPAGSYDVRFEPPLAQQLVAREMKNVAVQANVSLGIVSLQSGFVLSGSVLGFDGTAHAEVDVDVRDVSTGLGVYLGHDNTNAAGAYAVIVPAGIFDIRFSPPFSIPYGAITHPNVTVAANKVQHGTLPSSPFYELVGSGIAGTGGFTPAIESLGGAPRIGNSDYRVRVTQARGFAKAIVVYSLNPMPNPLPSPCAALAPMNRRVFQLGGAPGAPGAGSGEYAFPFANDPLLVGHLFRAWIYVRDSANPNGLARTNELRAIVSY